MAKDTEPKVGVITRIYGEENRDHLVGRGIGANGDGFSNRDLELDEEMQVIVTLDDDSIARPAPPEEKK